MGRDQSLVRKLKTNLVRPFRLLLTQPIVIALTTYMAYIYGLVRHPLVPFCNGSL